MRTNDVPMAHELVRFYQIKGLKPPLNELKRLLHFFVQTLRSADSTRREVPVQWTTAFELLLADPLDADDGVLITFVRGLLDLGLHEEALREIERCTVANSALVTDRVYAKLVQYHLSTGNLALALALLGKHAESLPAADAQQSQLWLNQFALVLRSWLSIAERPSASASPSHVVVAGGGARPSKHASTSSDELERTIERQLLSAVCENHLQCDAATIQVRHASPLISSLPRSRSACVQSH